MTHQLGFFVLGYASSSSGAGLYNSNSYDGQNYGPKYPYSNQYTGYAGGAVNSGPYYPQAPFANPYEFNNAFQQYFNQLSAFNAKYEYLNKFHHQISKIVGWKNSLFFCQFLRQLTTTYAGEGALVSAKASLGPSKYKTKKINE